MRRILVAAASAALLFGSALASAETLTGRVVVKDATANTLTIQTDAGQQVMLQTANASFRGQQGSIDLARVQVGDQVRVQTDDAAAQTGNQRAATSVEVTNAVAQAPPTGTSGMQPGTEPERTADENPPAAERRMARLPKTAGPLPLIGVAGAASLLAGLVLRRSRR